MNRLLPFLLTLTALAVAAPAARAEAPTPVGLSAGYGPLKLTREECGRKAVEAMTAGEKFPFAEVTDDGNARGWNGKTAVLVLSFPRPDSELLYVAVVAAGANPEETERVRLAVQKYLTEGPPDPKTPARVIPADGKIPPAPFTLSHKSEDRGAVQLLRLFDAAATIVLEKKGYQVKTMPGVAMGFTPDRALVTFLAPTATATTIRLTVRRGRHTGRGAGREDRRGHPVADH